MMVQAIKVGEGQSCVIKLDDLLGTSNEDTGRTQYHLTR